MPIKAFTIVVLLIAPHVTNAGELRGYVVRITDGDTLTVLVDQQPHKIRVVGIDAPERRQPFGERSKQNLAALAFNKNAIADCTKKDRYKRDLCRVFVGGQDVGLKQITDGMAWWYRKYAHEQRPTDRVAYEQAEVMARRGRVGLWVDRDAVPPWEWRKRARP